jgi:hypothetical protein
MRLGVIIRRCPVVVQKDVRSLTEGRRSKSGMRQRKKNKNNARDERQEGGKNRSCAGSRIVVQLSEMIGEHKRWKEIYRWILAILLVSICVKNYNRKECVEG